MAKINKYQIDWVNDDTSQIPTKADGPDFWADIWKAGRKDTIFEESVSVKILFLSDLCEARERDS